MSFYVGLEITKKCNFKCVHCFVDAGQPRDYEMTTAEMMQLLQDLASCGTHTIGWSGGEPLIRHDLEELTYFGSRMGMRFSLATNGYLAHRQRLISLKACGIHVIQISLDGVTEEKATRFRKGPKNSFQRILQSIKDSVSIGLQTHICTLLAPETASELEDMLFFARSLGVNGLRYTMMAPVGRAESSKYEESAWNTPEIKHFFEIVESQKSQRDPAINIDCPIGPYPGYGISRCNAGRESAYITADGDLYPCTALMTSEYLVGNTLKQPVADLLFSDNILKIQRQIAKSLPGDLCTPCHLRHACRGGCPGRSLSHFGTFQNGDLNHGMPACMLRIFKSP